VAALATADVAALSTAQAYVLSSAQLAALSSDQAVAIETSDIAVLKTNAIPGLSTQAIAALTTDAIHALTTQQIHALTNAQLSALTTDQIGALASLTPIVLDLNGNGIETLAANQGVKFDLLANGHAQQMGWVAGGDGLLAMDRNGDGTINDGSELFGSGTTLANGHKAGTGYQALAELDGNADGKLDAADAAFGQLKVWVDANADGVSQAGELKSMDELKITAISVDATKNVSLNNGNLVGLTSDYTTADGATHTAADVWFKAAAPADGMRGSVSGMVQAMSAFGEQVSAAARSGALRMEADRAGVAGHVANLASALGQFDADGKPRLSSTMAGTDQSLRLKALEGGAGHGILATPNK